MKKLFTVKQNKDIIDTEEKSERSQKTCEQAKMLIQKLRMNERSKRRRTKAVERNTAQPYMIE